MTPGATPDRLFAELFEQVQATRLFPDSKTFVDATAKHDPSEILNAFRRDKKHSGFDLSAFVHKHFDVPAATIATPSVPAGLPVEQRIEQLWDLLQRAADEKIAHSSLLPLPNPYIVPGGRFREVYYWDSYFTMLGLADSGRVALIRNMVENFAWLIDEIGFIPNGNRTYYCTRSQPPFFSLMVELLADVTGDDAVYARYLPHLMREYEFWMAGAETLTANERAHRRVVLVGGVPLNRYWDDATSPRQESHAEDVALAAATGRAADELYRDLRAGAESGWDYSARWFADLQTMATIRTTQVIPVDLNSLLWNLETLLARICKMKGASDRARFFETRAAERKRLLRSLFFDATTNLFMDLALPGLEPTGALSIATAYPLYFGIATREQARRVASRINEDFLQAGGWVSTLHDTGQQWDRPNGWAPLQWIVYCGLRRYGFDGEARRGAARWVANNIAVYKKHGRLLEKYNVETSGLSGAGGEYEVQDGFGWTNAVLLRLMQKLEVKR